MVFFDFLSGKKKCPQCGTRGAKEIKHRIHCPNPSCAYFSKLVGQTDAGPTWTTMTPSPPDHVPAGSVAVQYRNFRGLDKTFVAEIASARRSRNHIIVKVAPNGARIALSRGRIGNMQEVEAALPPGPAPGQEPPTSRERQVLSYHKNRGTTSALYRSLRAKFPNW